MIGDPTGRDAAREPLTEAQVEDNFKDYKRQAQKILDFSKNYRALQRRVALAVKLCRHC